VGYSEASLSASVTDPTVCVYVWTDDAHVALSSSPVVCASTLSSRHTSCLAVGAHTCFVQSAGATTRLPPSATDQPSLV
jgi:hypothetical protein